MSKLKELRLAAGFSQSQLAKKVGINVRTIQHYEQKGSSRVFDHSRIDTILKICNALNCRLADIIEDPTYIEIIKEYEK